MKQYQNKQLATEAGQLFSAIQGPTDLPFQGAFSAGNGKIVQAADEFEKR